MYVDMRTQIRPRSPGINVATHKSQSCCLFWCSCFAKSGSKSTLMSGGAGIAPRVLYTAAGCAHVLRCLWQSKFNLACLLQNTPFFGLWACMLFAFLHCVPCMWNQHPGTKRKKTWMKDATCRSSTRSLQKAKRIYNGPKIGVTNLEAGLLILVLWPHFWVQNLAPALGPQNTNRSYSIRAASVLLPLQSDSSTYPWYCVYNII